MRKTLILLGILFITTQFLISCKNVEVASSVPIDRRYTPPRDEIVTTYQYRYDWYNDELKMLPYVSTVHHNEKYEILYKITYDDGSTKKQWKSVSKTEYDSFG